MPKRYAFVGASVAQVEPYLPHNYTARALEDGSGTIIVGEDNAGWTLDGYVIPRLASGLIFATEATADAVAERGPYV